MTPRKTQQGASASTRKAPVNRRARGASSARASTTTRAVSASAHPRKPASAREKRDASWFRWWLLPIFVVAAAAIFIATYYPVARVQYMETRQRAQLQAQLSALQTRNARLNTQVARLKTPEGVEDYARSQLGMVKRGDHLIVVTDGAGHASAATTATTALGATPEIDSSTETTAAPRGPWTAFLDSVFDAR
jgi:cell division protein FtsL